MSLFPSRTVQPPFVQTLIVLANLQGRLQSALIIITRCKLEKLDEVLVDCVADVGLGDVLLQGRDIGKDAGISATVGRLFSEEPQAAIEEAGPPVLGSDFQTLAKLEGFIGHRSAGDGDSMAPQRIQAFLAMEVSKEAWPSAGLSRNPGIDPKDIAGESHLGCAAD